METTDAERLPLYLSVNDPVAVSSISRAELYNRRKSVRSRHASCLHFRFAGKMNPLLRGSAVSRSTAARDGGMSRALPDFTHVHGMWNTGLKGTSVKSISSQRAPKTSAARGVQVSSRKRRASVTRSSGPHRRL